MNNELDDQKFNTGDKVRKKTTGETGEIVKLNTNGKHIMASYLVKPKEGASVYWWEHDIEICHECGGYMKRGGTVAKIKVSKDGKSISGAKRYVNMSLGSLKQASKHLSNAISEKHKEVSRGIKEGEYKKRFEKSLHSAKNKLKDIQEAISHKMKFESGGNIEWNYFEVTHYPSNSEPYVTYEKQSIMNTPPDNSKEITKEDYEHNIRYEKGGEIDDYKGSYMMLGRLQSDCDYYLSNGGRSERRLWAGSIDAQIEEMKRIWNSLPKEKKPEWLSMEDILKYERCMKNKYEKGGIMPDCPCMHEDGGELDEYAKGGFLYEITKKGHELTLQERIMDAKNIPDLKNRIIEKFGSLDGITAKKRIGNGAFAHVNIHEKGGSINEEDLTKGEIENKIKGVQLQFAKLRKQYPYAADGMQLKYRMEYEKKSGILREKLAHYNDLYGKAKYEKGGQVTFKQKSNAVAKRLEGEDVPKKYQPEYGKTYSKEEAHEAADKIIGKFVSRTRMKAKGGTVISKDKLEELEDEFYSINSKFIKLQLKCNEIEHLGDSNELKHIENEMESYRHRLNELLELLSKVSTKWKKELEKRNYKNKYSEGDRGYWEGMNVEIVGGSNQSYHVKELGEDGKPNPNTRISPIKKKLFESRFHVTRMKSKGGSVGFNWNKFTLKQLDKEFCTGKDIEITSFLPKGSKEYAVRVDYAKDGNKSLSIGEAGKSVILSTGSENIYLDLSVYDNSNDKEYVISIFSKDNRAGLKSLSENIINSFKKGGNVRSRKAYSKMADSYKWFVVDTEKNKVITGYEDKQDCIDLVKSDYKGEPHIKVVSERSLSKLGIENPKSKWKSEMGYKEGGEIKKLTLKNLKTERKIVYGVNGMREDCIFLLPKLKNECKKAGLRIENMRGDWNSYGYTKLPQHVILNNEEDKKKYISIYNKGLSIIKKQPKQKSEDDVIKAWVNRLVKLTGIDKEEAEDIAEQKLDANRDNIMEMEDRQSSSRYSIKREKLIDKMKRENPLRRINDIEHANAILAASKRHQRSNYDYLLSEATDLVNKGELDPSERKDYARKNFKF